MTVLSVNTRINAPPLANNTTLTSIGGGAGAEATDDPAAFFYHSTGIIYRKVTSTSAGGAGFSYTHPSTTDMTVSANSTMMCKFLVSDFGGLNTTEGASLRIGNDLTNYYDIPLTGTDVAGTALDSYPAKGGFIIVPIDPSISAYRRGTTGTPALATVDYFGITARFASASAKAENLGLDAIDLGTGLEIHTSGNMADFVLFDEGTTTNRFGYSTELTLNTYNQFGTLFFGRNAGATAVLTMTDSVRETWNFPDGMFAAGWSGILLDASSATTVTLTNKTVTGIGTITTEDTRPVINTIGTTGTYTLDNWTITNFAKSVLTSAISLINSIVINSDEITQDGATFTQTLFDSPAIATGERAILADDVDIITDCHFESSGVGHAVELTSAHTSPVQWDGNKLTDYSGTVGDNPTSNTGSLDAGIYNNSGKAIEIQVVNGASTPSVRNGAGATTTVVASLITLSVTVLDDSTGSPLSTAHVWLGRNSDKSVLISGVTNASGIITASIAYDADTDVIGWARQNDLIGTDYTPKDISGQYTSSGFSTTVRLLPIG